MIINRTQFKKKSVVTFLLFQTLDKIKCNTDFTLECSQYMTIECNIYGTLKYAWISTLKGNSLKCQKYSFFVCVEVLQSFIKMCITGKVTQQHINRNDEL